MSQEEGDFSLSHAEPVLAVSDVPATVQYWHDVLGFREKWTWGEPPNHGGVAWQGVYIQFHLSTKPNSGSRDSAIFIRVKNLEALYEFHQKRNAEITEPIENKPWGLAGYAVRDINGYHIDFAGALISAGRKNKQTPAAIRIVPRIPTPEEYVDLIFAVGWEKLTNLSKVENILAAPAYSVVAENENNQAIGCAFLIGDNASLYYVKDVIVHPAWQGKGVGSQLMKHITQWIDANAPANAFTGLFTGENLAPFYKKFSFTPAFGMYRRVSGK